MLRGWGWQLEGTVPNRHKMIFAVAPHSTNLDFILTISVIMALGLKASFLAKQSLFRFPLNLLVAGFGGIPVDRNAAAGVVGDMTIHFDRADKLILGIAPEGTRANVSHWRSGFAQIAQAANVPVLPAIINYDKKIVTFKALIEDVTDSEATLIAMQAAAASGAGRPA